MDKTVLVVHSTPEEFRDMVNFYRDTLQLRAISTNSFRADGVTIYIEQDENSQRMVGTTVAFATENVLNASYRLIGKGISIPGGIKYEAYGRYIVIADPRGNSIKLVEWKNSNNGGSKRQG